MLEENYDSLYVPTFPSMSHMLTGEEPEVSEGRYHWLEKAHTNGAFPDWRRQFILWHNDI